MKRYYFLLIFSLLSFSAFCQWTISGTDLSTTYNQIILNSAKQSTATLWFGPNGTGPSTIGHYYIKAYDYWGPYLHFQASGDNGNEKMNVTVDGNVGIGTTSPLEKLDVIGKIKWGTNPNSNWGFGLMSLNSGWNSGNYPTLGSTGGSQGSLIMLHNPHIPFRTDNNASGYSGRAGLRMAIDANASAYWDMGLAGDFFNIYRSGGKGEFLRISNQGNVGIGTISPDYKLDVLGTIRAQEVKVATGWSDFVFEPEYDLPTLQEIENFINQNGHLPDIPSAEEVKADGISLGEMEAKLLQKIEELILYVIELEKSDKRKQEKIEELENIVNKMSPSKNNRK
jgi:hypothetical protein